MEFVPIQGQWDITRLEKRLLAQPLTRGLSRAPWRQHSTDSGRDGSKPMLD